MDKNEPLMVEIGVTMVTMTPQEFEKYQKTGVF